MVVQKTLEVQTCGRGMQELTREVSEVVRNAEINAGLCHVFILHTSASLLISENADPTVQTDLETFMSAVAPDGDTAFRHTAEGPDDMPAHIRSILTGSSLNLPIQGGRLQLGTWQGVYLWEHRHRGHTRRVMVTVCGE